MKSFLGQFIRDHRRLVRMRSAIDRMEADPAVLWQRLCIAIARYEAMRSAWLAGAGA